MASRRSMVRRDSSYRQLILATSGKAGMLSPMAGKFVARNTVSRADGL